MLGSAETRAVLAGFFAAGASVCAKVAVADGPAVQAVRAYGGEYGDLGALAFTGMFLGGLVACNAIMWTLFVQSLAGTSSVRATVVNNASNYFFSGSVGWLLFSELLPIMWWMGAALIICGVILVVSDEKAAPPDASSDPADAASDALAARNRSTVADKKRQ